MPKCLSGDKNCQHQLQIVHNDKMSSIQNEIKISKDNSEFDVSKIKDQLDKLTNMQKQCNMIIEGFTEQLKMFKTYVVKFFDHLHKLIEENKILIIQIIDNNDEPNIQFLKQLSTQIEKEKKELSNKIVGMDKKNKIASKGTNFSMDPNALQNDQSFDKIIMGFEKKIHFYSNDKFPHPFFSLESINQALMQITSICKVTSVSSNDSSALLKKPYSLFINYPRLLEGSNNSSSNLNLPFNDHSGKKILNLNDIKKFENKVSKRKIKKNEYASCFHDPVSKKYYYYEGYSKINLIFEFLNLDNLFSNTMNTNISLNSTIEGTNSFAQGGYLFHRISASSKLGKTNLETGEIAEMIDLGPISFNKRSARSYSTANNVCLYNDLQANCQYTSYQKQGEENVTLSQLICFPKFMLGKSWNLPINFSHLDFGLINDYLFYIGHYKGQKSTLSHVFNLIDGSVKLLNNYIIPIPNEDFASPSYIPSESTFLVAKETVIERYYVNS